MGLLNRLSEFLDGVLELDGRSALDVRLGLIARELGLRYVWSDDIGVYFFERHGRTYSIGFSQLEDRIVVSAHCRLGFRQGSVPQPLVEYLMAENRKMNYADWIVTSDEGESHIYLRSSVRRFAELDAGLVTSLVEKLVVPVIALDQTLVERGEAQYWR